MAFCSKHVNCDESIAVIAKILSNNEPLKFAEISKEFNSLGFLKVKDLARSTLGKASSMTLDGGDPLEKLYGAVEIYDQLIYGESFADRLINAKLNYQNGHYIEAIEICEELLLLQFDFDVLLILSASYYKCGEYEKSKEFYVKAYFLNNNSPEVITGFGLYFWQNGQYEQAHEFFWKALRLSRFHTNHWINYFSVLLKYDAIDIITKMDIFNEFMTRYHDSYRERNIYGQFLLSENYVKEAKKQFKLAKLAEPDHSKTWRLLGDTYMLLEKDEKAICHYEAALTLNQNCNSTWNNLGLAYFNLSNYEKVISTLLKSLQLFPSDFTALNLLADTYFEQKNMQLAVETYEKCLELNPDDSQINSFLGFIYFYNLKNCRKAEKYLKISMKINYREDVFDCLSYIYITEGKYKDAAEIFKIWGDLYFEQNKFEKSSARYNLALILNSDDAEVHWKMGVTCYQMNLLDVALSRYRYSIDLKPNFSNVYCDCALLFEEKQLPLKAIEYYKMALQLDPDHENALHNMLILKQKLGHVEDVVVLLKRILEFDADIEDTFFIYKDLGKYLYTEMGNPVEALFNFKKASDFNNSDIETYIFMGNIFINLHSCKNNEDALNCFMTAIDLNPKCVVAHTSIGSIHKDNQNFKEAIKSYKTALGIKPNCQAAYCNLVQCLRHICDWSNYDECVEKIKDIIHQQLIVNHAPSLMPHHYLLYPFAPSIFKTIAWTYAKYYFEKSYITRKLSEKYTYPTSLSSSERIRVGYVTTDFGYLPMTQLKQSILNFHDKDKFEIFYYSLLSNDYTPSWTTIFEETDNFKPDFFKLNSVAAANKINNDGIHILVNLNGYTNNVRNEIFALRPAPIQVLWHAYPGTSDPSFIDYIITDKVCCPPNYEKLYGEKMAYMNRTVFISGHKLLFDDMSPRVIGNMMNNTVDSTSVDMSVSNGDVDSLENNSSDSLTSNTKTSMYSVKLQQDESLKCYTRLMYNLPEDDIVYCNFNQSYKIDPPTFNVWITILKKVPNSVLWLLSVPGDGEKNLRAYAAKQDLDQSRIIFSNLESKDDHMRRIQLADIFLDTLMYNGRMTCLDAIWAGMPIVTLPGIMFPSRVTASVLTTMGCTNLIAKNENDYIEIAMKLGLDKVYLENVRSLIWRIKYDSQLFDNESYTRDLECVYTSIYKKYLTDKKSCM